MGYSDAFSRNLEFVCHDLRHDGDNPKDRLNGVLRGRNLVGTKQCYGVRLVATRKMSFGTAFSRIKPLRELYPQGRIENSKARLNGVLRDRKLVATKRCTAFWGATKDY